jgi:hypothetical protein
MVGERAGIRIWVPMVSAPLPSISTSVQSSFSSGSGLDWAKSAASCTIALISSSIFLISASSVPPSSSIFLHFSIGSDWSRICCTSSRFRYLAGSDMEWPR